MNTILLQPTDVLFFRDGRPMTGSLAGHGAAWPMPNVINGAFHAALHRAKLDADGAGNLHVHRRGAHGVYAEDAQRDRKFGSLVTAGPFPVKNRAAWFFPRPHDIQDATLHPTLLPTDSFNPDQSSLSGPLKYAVANRLPPDKESPAKAWLSREAFQTYLGTGNSSVTSAQMADHAVADSDLFDCEHTIGIAIDPDTGTTGKGEAAGKIYSAHYLRLREAWQLGVCAAAEDKEFRHPQHGSDLVKTLLNGGQHQITVGGQQRISSALRMPDAALPLPRGAVDGFQQREGKLLVKWVLLSPAVWPAIEADMTGHIKAHPGGWLPNWIAPQTGKVLLKSRDTARGQGEGREAWRRRVRQQESISAKLVAAIIPKPLVVTGWALPDEAAGEAGGAQSIHLAVPAGAIYYFEADSADEARKLAATLNWHGCDSNPTTIKNRRSTLLGEKGFGLGVCGTWQFYKNVAGRSGK
jgi:CRISPR-associated protein Cmr3